MPVWLVTFTAEDIGMPAIGTWKETISVSAETLTDVEKAVRAHKVSSDAEIKLVEILSASKICELAIDKSGAWVKE